MEDDFPTGRPEFETVGVQFTTDVAAYEQVKLRMLNGSHVTLAYPAILLGYRIVHEAMADDDLRRLLSRFMTDDVMPLLTAPPGMPLDAYRDKLLERFTNPAIGDQIARLCLDGAAKLPVYILPTLAAALDQNRNTSRIAFMLACYVRHLAGRDDHGNTFTPAEPNLTDADRALATSGDALHMSFLRPLQLDTHPTFAAEFTRITDELATHGARHVVPGRSSEEGQGALPLDPAGGRAPRPAPPTRFVLLVLSRGGLTAQLCNREYCDVDVG